MGAGRPRGGAALSDLRPPKLQGDELATLHALLQYTRESLVRKVDGVSDGDARRTFVGSGTTLLWLVKHVRMAETLWVCKRFADDGTVVPDDTVTEADTLARAVDAYRDTWVVTDAVVFGATSLDDVCRGPDAGDPPVNLRWVLGHLLEENARHAGHADVLREFLDGSTGR